MQQDNIKDFAVAAFRFYGQALKNKIKPKDVTASDWDVFFAAALTVKHLQAAQDYDAAEGIRQVYFALPPGNLRRGTISNTVRRAAYDMHISEGNTRFARRCTRVLCFTASRPLYL